MPHACLWPDTARIDPRANPVRDAIAIYLLELDIPRSLRLQPHYLSYLDPAEGERWRHIRSPERQWQYLQSRVLRRVLLSAYSGREPTRLMFTRDACGRLRLSDHQALYFSLTQCASHVAMAIGTDAVLGIDAETIFPVRPSFQQIARLHFSAAELRQLQACPEARRYSYFLELWTLKQAYLKALGRGVHKPLADISFARTGGGLLLCQDQAPPPGREAPTAFISEQWVNSCQLALAQRAGLPVSVRYLNGSGLTQAWPHAHLAGAGWPQPAGAVQPLPS